MAKVISLSHLSVTEFDDGHAIIRRSTMDMATRKMVEENLMQINQVSDEPMTVDEMLLCGAAELVGRDLYGKYPLPW